MKNLKKLYEYCLSRDIPAISPPTQEFLKQKLLGHKPRRCLEIGSASGYSTLFFSEMIQEWGGKIISSEISYNHYLYALTHLQEKENILLYPFALDRAILSEIIYEPFDFVFIDCAKKSYAEYFEMIVGYVSDTAIIILDDVIKYKSKLQGLYSYLDKNKINYKIIQLDDGDGVMVIDMKGQA